MQLPHDRGFNRFLIFDFASNLHNLEKNTHTIDCYALAILWKGTVYKQVVFL